MMTQQRSSSSAEPPAGTVPRLSSSLSAVAVLKQQARQPPLAPTAPAPPRPRPRKRGTRGRAPSLHKRPRELLKRLLDAPAALRGRAEVHEPALVRERRRALGLASERPSHEVVLVANEEEHRVVARKALRGTGEGGRARGGEPRDLARAARAFASGSHDVRMLSSVLSSVMSYTSITPCALR